MKGSMQHVWGGLERVTQLRTRSLSAGTVKDQASAEGAMSRALGAFFAAAENYPELKANQNFLELQSALGNLEEQIQLARGYDLATVRDLNILVHVLRFGLDVEQQWYEQFVDILAAQSGNA
nr:LemA family protein [Desulfosoma caldarium]